VEFIFVDEPADENWAMIIAGESNPKLGLISVHTPVAQALLGSAVGAEVLAPLPVGLRKLKVLAIQKHSVAHPADYAQEDNDVLIHVPLQPPPRPSNHPRREGFRTIHVKVTQGMINQNLLTLTEYVNRGVVRIGEEFTIKSDPPGEFFKTDLVQHGNKLRERGAIARFYRMAGVRAGDSIVLTEIAPRRWKLTRVAGQRDLDARDPRFLLRGNGTFRRSAEGRWAVAPYRLQRPPFGLHQTSRFPKARSLALPPFSSP
jgi:hypothetical protein